MYAPLISIIIPIYKIEPYLRRCLDSITGQTYQNLEIVLVDDGSPDKCREICDEYASKDSRIIIVGNESVGRGAGSARNKGLSLATGEYVAFVDGDDWVADIYIETLWNAIVSCNAEMAICNYSDATQPFSFKIFGLSAPLCEILEPHQAIIRLLQSHERVTYVTPWGKLIKTSLLDGIRFPEGVIFEDEYVAHKVLYRSKKTAFVDLPLYCYFQRKDSVMGQTNVDAIRALHARVERFLFFKEQREKELAELCLRGLCWQLLSAYTRGKPPQGFSSADEIIRLFRTLQKDHWKSTASTLGKIKLRVFALCPALYIPYHWLATKIRGA